MVHFKIHDDLVLGATRQEDFMGTCWKVFMSSNVPMLNAFHCLGDSLTVYVYNEMEQDFLQLYDSERPSAISNVAELRWYMFSKYPYESEKLASTKMALDQKVLQTHYTTLTWKSTHIPSPILPDENAVGH